MEMECSFINMAVCLSGSYYFCQAADVSLSLKGGVISFIPAAYCLMFCSGQLLVDFFIVGFNSRIFLLMSSLATMTFFSSVVWKTSASFGETATGLHEDSQGIHAPQ